METYEMYRKLRKYESMCDNVRVAYNTLSKTEVQDNLATAIHTLKTSYIVNGNGYMADNAIKLKEELTESIKSLGECLVSANYNVSKLSSTLNDAEAGGK